MASGEVYTAIKDYLTPIWTETPIQWENEDFTPVMSGWVSIEITGTVYGQESLGADDPAKNRWDEDGILWAHFLVRQGDGSEVARSRAKNFVDLFRGTTLLDDRLEFQDASIGLGERGDTEGLMWRLSVSIEWRHMDA